MILWSWWCRQLNLSCRQTADFPHHISLFSYSCSHNTTIISRSSNNTPNMPPSVPWPPATGVFATYPLQCHCAAIKYTITVSPPLLESDSEGKGIYTTLECDCTHCERKGIIACHPKLADVKFTQGLEHRGEYYCAAKKNPHWVCKICGSSLSDSSVL
jgi:hypothetical protein